MAPENAAMIQRLRTALSEGKTISGADASFYMHELAEATLMDSGMGPREAHDAALAKYGVSPYSVYHPEVISAFFGRFNDNWLNFWNTGGEGC